MKLKIIHKILSAAGMSLVETAIGMGLVGGAALVGMKLMESTAKGGKNNDVKADISTIRTQIIATLQHQPSFHRTLFHFNNRDAFSCLKIEGPNDDCRNVSGEFRLYRFTSTEKEIEMPYVSLSSDTSIGFSKSGVVCQNFNAGAGQGSDGCPYKYVASWTPVCPDVDKIQGQNSVETKCRNPLFNIHVKLLFNPKNPEKFPRLSTEKVDIRLTLAQAGSDKNQLCSLAGNGYFDETAEKCIILKAGQDSCDDFCGPGTNSFVQGFYDDGSVKCSCAPVPATSCGNNKILVGVNDDGTLQCQSALIAGLEYSNAIQNTPESYFSYLQQRYQEAVQKKNTALASQTQAQRAVTAAQTAYDAADNAARAAQQAVDAARAQAGSAPTAAQTAAVEAAVANFNQKMQELSVARAQLDRATVDLNDAAAAETIAKQKMDEQALKM